MYSANSTRPASLPSAALHELPLNFSPCEFRVKWVDCDWERRQAHALRREVFCDEQGVFTSDDSDALDAEARLIVALACVAGIADAVVGTVRIHERSPGEWWGSRLAVARSFRSHGRLGATLIRLAVCSAHSQGCARFFAHVQAQNVPLFRRLHWQALREIDLHGRGHSLMQADLSHYPPYATPYAGFVARSSGASQ
jgi:putative N-acetyltransferase (TIGR04045 family)